MLKSTHIYHDAWADNGTATVSIHHTPYSVWLLGKLMLQLLLIDPQLSEKHWLIESWYKSAVPWVSRVYGLYPSHSYMYSLGAGIHITSPRVQISYTLETHGTTVTCMLVLWGGEKQMYMQSTWLTTHTMYWRDEHINCYVLHFSEYSVFY